MKNVGVRRDILYLCFHLSVYYFLFNYSFILSTHTYWEPSTLIEVDFTRITEWDKVPSCSDFIDKWIRRNNGKVTCSHCHKIRRLWHAQLGISENKNIRWEFTRRVCQWRPLCGSCIKIDNMKEEKKPVFGDCMTSREKFMSFEWRQFGIFKEHMEIRSIVRNKLGSFYRNSGEKE